MCSRRASISVELHAVFCKLKWQIHLLEPECSLHDDVANSNFMLPDAICMLLIASALAATAKVEQFVRLLACVQMVGSMYRS